MKITTGEISAIISELAAIFGILVPVILNMKKLSNGSKCQLRSEMLRIYYHNKDSQRIRQYEYENFVLLYEAYKALKGNSFIDRIYNEIKEWKIET